MYIIIYDGQAASSDKQSKQSGTHSNYWEVQSYIYAWPPPSYLHRVTPQASRIRGAESEVHCNHVSLTFRLRELYAVSHKNGDAFILIITSANVGKF